MKTLTAAMLFTAVSLTAYADKGTPSKLGVMGTKLETTYVFEATDCDDRVIGWLVMTPDNAYSFRPPSLDDPEAVKVLSRAVVTAAKGGTFFKHTIVTPSTCPDRKQS